MAVAYVDASAISKLVHAERGSAELDAYLSSCEVVSSDLSVTEVARGVRRVAQDDRERLGELLEKAMIALEEMTLITVETGTLVRAGAIQGAFLRSLDAIHIATAQLLGDVDVFVTYDERQAAAARLAGLHTISPGA
ncbi:MAG: type II toxin-antitoxin system VapC family toxin [Gaiellales bacterium]